MRGFGLPESGLGLGVRFIGGHAEERRASRFGFRGDAEGGAGGGA